MNILPRTLCFFGGTGILLYSVSAVVSFAEASDGQDKLSKREIYKKSCRACTDFKTWAYKYKKANFSQTSTKSAASSVNTANIHHHGMSTINNTRGENPLIKTEDEWPRECPADRIELGNATWTFLHTMAEYYSQQPTETQQNEMKQFLITFSKIFPCEECADHFRDWIVTHPPDVSSSLALNIWLCTYHNVVNKMLGKPTFSCEILTERWKEGWDDGSCD